MRRRRVTSCENDLSWKSFSFRRHALNPSILVAIAFIYIFFFSVRKSTRLSDFPAPCVRDPLPVCNSLSFRTRSYRLDVTRDSYTSAFSVTLSSRVAWLTDELSRRTSFRSSRASRRKHEPRIIVVENYVVVLTRANALRGIGVRRSDGHSCLTWLRAVKWPMAVARLSGLRRAKAKERGREKWDARAAFPV